MHRDNATSLVYNCAKREDNSSSLLTHKVQTQLLSSINMSIKQSLYTKCKTFMSLRTMGTIFLNADMLNSGSSDDWKKNSPMPTD